MSGRLEKRAVVSGFVGAALASIGGSALSPEYLTTALGLIGRAMAYVTAVFGLTAIAAQLVFWVRGKELNARREDIAIETATAALWFPPLLMFWLQRSWFVLAILVVLALNVAHLIAFLDATQPTSQSRSSEASGEYQLFSLLERGSPFGPSILGAFMLQGAIFAGLDGHVIIAGLLYLAGTAAVAHRAFQMFRDLPTIGEPNSMRFVGAALIATSFLIVFAWLPHLIQSGVSAEGHHRDGGGSSQAKVQTVGTGIEKSKGRHGNAPSLAWLASLFQPQLPGSRDDSFAVAKRLLNSTFPESLNPNDSHAKTGLNTNGAAMMILGPVFPGVRLYPEALTHTRLVAPPLSGYSGVGTAHTDALSIPFDGVYWFWRGPSEVPPSNSVVMHGSPSAQFFRSTDGDGMSMEAKQNLGFSVDPRSYGGIELDIQNADPFPNSISIMLKVRNTALAAKPIQSLGMENIVTPAFTEARAVTQTLRFRVPRRLTMRSFDELTVSYYLKGPRSNRSARIAIERFRLVPRR